MTYRFIRFFWRLFSRVPLWMMYLISDCLYYPVYYIGRYRRKVARKNLIEAFPEKSVKEIVKIEKRFYRFFVDLFFETCKQATVSEKTARERVKYTNYDVVNALFEQGKSITLYMAHYANWECLSTICLPVDPETGGITGQVYKRLSNKFADKLMCDSRERFGSICIEMNDTLRRVNQYAAAGQPNMIAYLADQSPKKRFIQHYVPFLNHQAPAFVGAEKITKRYGLAALYLDLKRVKRGYYEATFKMLHPDPQSLPDFELTDLYYKELEEIIRRQPEFYMWTHNRFKHALK